MSSSLRLAAGGWRPRNLGRVLAVCFLMLATADVAGIVRLCAADDGCGEVCARCWCKKQSANTHIRAACPCCRPQPGAQDPLHELGAIVPAPDCSTLALPVVSVPPGPARPVRSFTPSVPHPPPRA